MMFDDGTVDPWCDCGAPAWACCCDDFACDCGPSGCDGTCDNAGANVWEKDVWEREDEEDDDG